MKKKEAPTRPSPDIPAGYLKGEGEGTGEFGFCAECGGIVDVKVLPEDRLQARITAAVARRGYREGWTPGQFLGRQTAKMLEELAELAAGMYGSIPIPLWYALLTAGDTAKWQFDHGEWKEGYIFRKSLEEMREELIDMQVVLVNMAAALGELLKKDVDLMQGAVEKAERDEERGVR